MQTRRLSCSPRELRSTVLPLLRGRAFHTTTLPAYESIVAGGYIVPNCDGILETNWSFSHHSYFRQLGCVSICDLRTTTEEEIDRGLGLYNFLSPRLPPDIVVQLVLGEKASDRLITWAAAVQMAGPTIQGVPCIESGHPGPISIAAIDEVLITEICPESDPFITSLLRARDQRPFESQA